MNTEHTSQPFSAQNYFAEQTHRYLAPANCFYWGKFLFPFPPRKLQLVGEISVRTHCSFGMLQKTSMPEEMTGIHSLHSLSRSNVRTPRISVCANCPPSPPPQDFHIILVHVVSSCASILFITNRLFSSCCEPHYESEAECKTFHMKISFVCI